MGNENIIHVGAIRVRVQGSGNLVPTLKGLDSVNTIGLTPIVMTPTNQNEPVRLCNFVAQKVILRLEVGNLNDNFIIERIHIYIKPIYTQVPNIG